MNSAIEWLFAQFGGHVDAGAQSCYLCGAPCTEQYGSVAVLRQGWPELYNRLCEVFPHVRGYS